MARKRQPQRSESADDRVEILDPAPARENGEGEAQVEVKMKGPAAAVQAAAKRMAPEPAARPDRDREADETETGEDPIGALIGDPKNKVAITRIFPRKHKGRRCDTRLDSYQCPIADLEAFCEDIFERFGGKRFKVTIHPNTPTGESKILGSFVIENPDSNKPVFEDEEPEFTIPDGVDPTLQPSDDPLELAREAIRRKMKIVADRTELKEAQQALEDLEDQEKKSKKKAEDKEVKGPADELQELRAHLAKKDAEEKWEKRFDRLENVVLKLAENQNPKSDNGNVLIAQLMKSSSDQFTTMMTALTAAMKPHAAPSEESNFDKMLDRMSKLKQALGSDNDRVKGLEDTLIQMALDRVLEGGGSVGGDGEEDTVKYAIKQLTPVLKTYVEKQLDKDGKGDGISQEEFKKLVHEKSIEMARGAVDDLRKKGYIVDPNTKKNLPGPETPPGIEQKTSPAPQPQAEKPATQSNPPEASTEGEAMGKFSDMPGVGRVEIPPPPDHAAYDRKRAVNFVLDSLRSEIKSRVPWDRADESYVVGDAMDRWDDDLLDKVSRVENGEQLDAVLAPYGDADKIAEIKEAGKDETVKSWLRRLIVTLSDEFRRETSGAPEK